MLLPAYDSILTLVYPQECRICGNSVERSSDGGACVDCWDKVRIFGRGEITCKKCGAYLGDAGMSKGVSCPHCADHRYDRAVAGGIYEFGLAAAVVGLKSKPYLPERCRPILLAALSRMDPGQITLIIPVPLSPKRLMERGHNQAEVIAKFLSSKTGVSLSTAILVRKLHTPIHRIAMDQKAREMSVKNVFEVKNKAALSGARVLLVDDVLTSGATVSNCARVLKKNGASRVDVLTLARAIQKT